MAPVLCTAVILARRALHTDDSARRRGGRSPASGLTNPAMFGHPNSDGRTARRGRGPLMTAVIDAPRNAPRGGGCASRPSAGAGPGGRCSRAGGAAAGGLLVAVAVLGVVVVCSIALRVEAHLARHGLAGARRHRRLERPPHRPQPAGAPHAARAGRRHRPRPGRRGHAGRDPQPARRPRHPRRRRRRGAGGGRRHLHLRRRLAHRLRVVRVRGRRRWPAWSCTSSARSGGAAPPR